MNLNPQNLHCLALNYKGVAMDDIEPLYFVKSLQALCSEGAQISYPARCKKLWTEVELAIIVAKDGEQISEHDAPGYVAGYVVGADLTCENVANRDHHLAYSKSRKNFCPVSSKIVRLHPDEMTHLELSTKINGRVTQTGNLSQMILTPFKALSYVSFLTELKKGDILMTGTPAGCENNMLYRGDHVVHSIDKIGVLAYDII